MVKACLIVTLCTAAFGGSITYNYTGNTFNDCNGANFLNGNCPANSFSDYDIASLTFSAPLAANLVGFEHAPVQLEQPVEFSALRNSQVLHRLIRSHFFPLISPRFCFP